VARNLALNEAKHDWIALLDADDWYSDSRLSRLIEIATVHAFDVVADDQWLYFESELAPVRKRSERLPIFANANPVKGVSLQELLSNVGLGIVQPVVRREMLEKHNVRYRNAYRFGEDFRFLYDLLSCGGRMGVVNEALYNVRLHGNSLTSNRVAMYSGMIEVLEGIMVDEAAAESQSGLAALRKAIRQARVTRNYGLVMDPLKNGEFLKAMVALAGNPALSFLIISRLFSRFNKRMSRKFSKDKV
jgi:succinoglycan biosynthesis protein ExoO